MKTHPLKTVALAIALMVVAQGVFAQGTGFTYQGTLTDQGAPANGAYDFQFAVFPVATGGSAISTIVTEVPVSNGLFTVTLNFGPNIFTGADRWLDIRVRPGGGIGLFTSITPRQPLLPTPYAIYSGAMNASGLIGTIGASSIGDGTITSNKLAPNSVTSSQIATGAVTTADLAVDAVTASRLADTFQSGNIPFTSSSTGRTLTINFATPFESTPAVTLNSPHIGPTNITTTNFQVVIPPYGITVDNSPNTDARYLSMAVVNGNPAIAYYDETSGDLKYCRALTTNGSTWGAPVVAHVGGANLVGKYPSLAVVNGRPAVAYYDDTNDDLKYVRANDVNGTSWAAAITVTSAGNVGQYAQLKVVNGAPAIAYFDATTNSVRFVRAVDADGAGWGTPISVEQGAPTNVVGEYCSLEIVNGNPAVAYRARTADVLRYCRAADVNGATWNAPVDINTSRRAGEEVSLAVVSGRPAVAFLTYGAQVNFERAGDADGTSWNFSQDVIGGVRDGIVPSGISLRVVAGLPRIAYWDGQSGYIFYTETAFAAGGGWKLPARIFGNTGTGGGSVALLDLNGVPVLAAPAFGAGLDPVFHTAAVIPTSWTAREAVKIEATSVAAGSITREMLAPGVLGNAVGGINAFAFGAASEALNDDAFAMGYFSIASGWASFAGGFAATASGIGSVALGNNAVSMAFGSIALGDNVIADRAGQVAVGRYNETNSGAVFMVGTGTFGARNNGLVVENDGDLEISGANARKPGGGSWAVPSDARLKNVEAKFDRGLEALRGIDPVSYHYKPDNAKNLPSEPRFIGPIAQDVERQIPEAVSRDEQGYRMVNNDPIIWTMFNAIKELDANTQALRSELKNKNSEVQSLKQQVKELQARVARERK